MALGHVENTDPRAALKRNDKRDQALLLWRRQGKRAVEHDKAGKNEEHMMSKKVKIELSEDEAEIVIDALESDREGYVEAAKEARGNTRRSEMETFTEAAERISAVMDKVRAALG